MRTAPSAPGAADSEVPIRHRRASRLIRKPNLKPSAGVPFGFDVRTSRELQSGFGNASWSIRTGKARASARASCARRTPGFLRGIGCYVDDIELPGLQEVAFLRSPLAHARILSIRKPPGRGAVGLRRRRPRYPSGPGQARPARLQVLRVSAAGAGEGALRRRSRRDVRGRDARRGRGSCRPDRARPRAAPRRRRCDCGTRRTCRAGARSMEGQSVSADGVRQGHRRGRRHRAGRGAAQLPPGAPGDEPARRQGRAGALGRAHQPARGLYLDAGAAHDPHRDRRASRDRAGQRARHRARRGRRLRLQMRAAARRAVHRLARVDSSERRSAGSRIGASI